MKRTANLVNSGSSCANEFDGHVTSKGGMSNATLLLFSGENPGFGQVKSTLLQQNGQVFSYK